jgi:radical SAM protein with 4Fe4S-binding SPASM domain
MTTPQGYMNPTLFQKIINQLPENTTIVPFFRGESLTHPLFPTYMRQLKQFKTVQLATNGDVITPANQQAILNACTFLSVSLHEFKYPNQTRFIGLLYDALGKGLETQVSILETLLPERKRKGFIKAWQKHVNKVRIYKEHSINGFGDILNTPQPTTPCHKPFEDMIIYWNGNVGLCNHDWNNSVYLGNLNTQSIKEVYNGSAYMNVRSQHLSGNRCAIATCKDCSFNSNKVYGEIINAHN